MSQPLSQKETAMVAGVLHLMLVGVWAVTLVQAFRRLRRLAYVAPPAGWHTEIGRRAARNRVWWVRGRDEFGAGLRSDTAHALHIPLLIFLVAYRATIER